MPSRRLTVAVGVLAGVASTGTAAARSVNSEAIEGLEAQLLYVALPLSLFVVVVLLSAVVRFYDNDDPKPTPEDPALEVTWTVATAVILLFVGISGYSVLVSPYVSPSQPADLAAGEQSAEFENLPETDDEVLHVRGYQWHWEVTYPDANVTTTDEIVIPADRDVTFWLTTDDVMHSLFLPDLDVKQDAYPDEYTRARTHAYETGVFDARCTEFCGPGHSRMVATLVVVEPDAYDAWLEENADSENASAPTPAVGKR